jgi:GT2 family glycosyltransferase
MSDTTLILPNYNNERALPLVFDSLRRYLDCGRLHFVMVDDGSVDNGVAVAKDAATRCGFASAEIIEQPHQGIVHALNMALAAANTAFIVRIDGDATIETPDWVSILLRTLRHPEVGIVGGQVIWETGRVHSFGRNVFSEYGLHDLGCCPMEPAGQRTFDSIVFRPFRQFQEGPPYEVDSILGVCAAFRRSEALAVGGFDLRFNPIWIEDDDFGLALRQLGRRALVDPRVHVVHRPGLRGSRQPAGSRGRSTLPGSLRRVLRPVVRRAKLARKAFSRLSNLTTIEGFIPIEADMWRAAILRSHYANWKSKWGFDPLNPDMHRVFDRYWETTFCWRHNPAQLEASRAFVKRLAADV